MKHIMTFMAALCIAAASFAADSLSVIYRIRLDQDIDQSAQRLVTLGLEKAVEVDADYVILDINTYGAALTAPPYVFISRIT